MQGIGFMELMAAEQDPSRWHELSAGLVAIRCAEAALLPGGVSGRQIGYAREVLSTVRDFKARRRIDTLLGVLRRDAVLTADERHSLARELFAYGVHLHMEAQFLAAIDTFGIIVDFVRDDEDLWLSAQQRIGFAYRMLNRFPEATAAYDGLHAAATRMKKRAMQLEAMLGHGRIDIQRGDLPAADRTIGMVFTRAKRLGIAPLLGKALLERATIAGMRRDPVSALCHMNEAIHHFHDAENRDRLRFNMAMAFREIGDRESAGRLAEFVAATAMEADMRMEGELLNMNLAVDAGDELTAERIARRLADVPKSPQVATSYHEACARAHAAAGRFREAEAAALEMRAIAEGGNMSEVRFRAEAALVDIRKHIVPKVYEFRPEKVPTAAERKLAAVRGSLAKICA